MLVRMKAFCPGQLADKLFRMMDENRQVFRADMQPGSSVFQRDQWNLIDTSFTNQAFRILISHEASLNWIIIIQLYSIVPTLWAFYRLTDDIVDMLKIE